MADTISRYSPWGSRSVSEILCSPLELVDTFDTFGILRKYFYKAFGGDLGCINITMVNPTLVW